MSQTISHLKTLLKQDINDLDTLFNLLRAEKSSLETRDNEQITRLCAHKSELVKQIDTRAKQKAKTIAGSGLGIKPGQVGAALATLGDQELSALWTTSLEKLEHCKHANQVNGAIISHSVQRTSKLMNIIRGQSNTPKLYGQQGKSQSLAAGQVIGKA